MRSTRVSRAMVIFRRVGVWYRCSPMSVEDQCCVQSFVIARLCSVGHHGGLCQNPRGLRGHRYQVCEVLVFGSCGHFTRNSQIVLSITIIVLVSFSTLCFPAFVSLDEFSQIARLLGHPDKFMLQKLACRWTLECRSDKFDDWA